jgi:MOSC domain-containing protein YiiM
MVTEHLAMADLEAGLDEIRRSPADDGRVVLIVRRPAEDVREVLEQAELDTAQGLVGDTWRIRGSSSTPDGSAHPDAQLTVMNARVVELLARQPDRRQLAGDQLCVDLDLSATNLPPHTRLAVGAAFIEITAKPHTGCAKFAARFGQDALRFVNSPVGRELHLRGLNARVVAAGTVRAGDVISKLPAADTRLT